MSTTYRKRAKSPRFERIAIRVTKQEREAIRARAKEKGMSVAAHMVACEQRCALFAE